MRISAGVQRVLFRSGDTGPAHLGNRIEDGASLAFGGMGLARPGECHDKPDDQAGDEDSKAPDHRVAPFAGAADARLFGPYSVRTRRVPDCSTMTGATVSPSRCLTRSSRM